MMMNSKWQTVKEIIEILLIIKGKTVFGGCQWRFKLKQTFVVTVAGKVSGSTQGCTRHHCSLQFIGKRII